MNRHTVVARLGVDDRAQVPARVGDRVTDLPFIDGRRRLGFGLGDVLHQMRDLGVRPSEPALDLALLGATLTAADTRISRAVDGQDGWSREIDLVIPVTDPRVWDAQAGLLKRMLDFLTGDRWRVRFRPRPNSARELTFAPGLVPPAAYTSVGLFSGGLDSYIGAIDRLGARERQLLFGHWWDGTTSAYQRGAFEQLQAAHGPRTPSLVRAKVGFRRNIFTGQPTEQTLRGRSFLFFSLAALGASALDQEDVTIHVPENGLISLNVPLDPLRLGAYSTRTTHPFYMARWNDLLAGLRLRGRLVNPYQYKTKGEMVAECADPALLDRTAVSTMSCSSPAKHRWDRNGRGRIAHCGYCVPCLIRRAALQRGLGRDDTDYIQDDLWSQPLNSRRARGEHVRSFQIAADRLRRRPRSAKTLIHQTGPLFDYPDRLDDIERVYREGLAEVSGLLQGVVSKPL